MPITSSKSFRRPYRVGRSRTGLGGFATRDIKKKELIDRYRGPIIDNKTADERDNRYMFEVNSRWTIDGSNRRNLARYFNHSCRPNAESDVKGHKVIIVARKAIQPGEEITYDYGKDYFDIFLKPIGCKCDKCREKRANERAEKRAKKLRAERRAAAAGKKQAVKRGKRPGAKPKPKKRK
jgi:SET domain-containing protein